MIFKGLYNLFKKLFRLTEEKISNKNQEEKIPVYNINETAAIVTQLNYKLEHGNTAQIEQALKSNTLLRNLYLIDPNNKIHYLISALNLHLNRYKKLISYDVLNDTFIMSVGDVLIDVTSIVNYSIRTCDWTNNPVSIKNPIPIKDLVKQITNG